MVSEFTKTEEEEQQGTNDQTSVGNSITELTNSQTETQSQDVQSNDNLVRDFATGHFERLCHLFLFHQILLLNYQ